MAVRYDVSTHGLLSPDALALEEPEFTAQNELAETILGLNGTDFEDEDEETALLAVALQLNYQVEAGVEAFVLVSTSRGARSKTFRDVVGVHPQAATIVANLPGMSDTDDDSDGFNIVTSLRGPSA